MKKLLILPLAFLFVGCGSDTETTNVGLVPNPSPVVVASPAPASLQLQVLADVLVSPDGRQLSLASQARTTSAGTNVTLYQLQAPLTSVPPGLVVGRNPGVNVQVIAGSAQTRA